MVGWESKAKKVKRCVEILLSPPNSFKHVFNSLVSGRLLLPTIHMLFHSTLRFFLADFYVRKIVCFDFCFVSSLLLFTLFLCY